jgi:hypothetical protein
MNILQNQQVQSDRIIPNTKPHIVIRDDEIGTCTLVDAAVSGERNVNERSREDSKI